MLIKLFTKVMPTNGEGETEWQDSNRDGDTQKE